MTAKGIAAMMQSQPQTQTGAMGAAILASLARQAREHERRTMARLLAEAREEAR